MRGRFIIEFKNNGLTIKDDYDHELIYQSSDNEQSDMENWAEFLYELTHGFGPDCNKWSDNYIYNIIAPGIKSDKWLEIHCPLCYREPQEGE